MFTVNHAIVVLSSISLFCAAHLFWSLVERLSVSVKKLQNKVQQLMLRLRLLRLSAKLRKNINLEFKPWKKGRRRSVYKLRKCFVWKEVVPKVDGLEFNVSPLRMLRNWKMLFYSDDGKQCPPHFIYAIKRIVLRFPKRFLWNTEMESIGLKLIIDFSKGKRIENSFDFFSERGLPGKLKIRFWNYCQYGFLFGSSRRRFLP